MIESMLGANPAVTTLPIGSEDNFEGVIDLVAMKAITWTGEVRTILATEVAPLALGGPHHLCLSMSALAARVLLNGTVQAQRACAFCADIYPKRRMQGIFVVISTVCYTCRSWVLTSMWVRSRSSTRRRPRSGMRS